MAKVAPEALTLPNLAGSALRRQFAWGKLCREMQLTVNGESRTFPDGLTVRGLVEALALTEGPVAVERNREVVPRAQHGETVLQHHDVIEIVHLVGGG
jgi:sulfur carrier protein